MNTWFVVGVLGSAGLNAVAHLANTRALKLAYASLLTQLAVWPGLDIRANPEIGSDQQALALGEIKLRQIIGDAIFQARAIHTDLHVVAGQVDIPDILYHNDY